MASTMNPMIYSPFQLGSLHQLPPSLSDFLENRDLLEFSCTNQSIREQNRPSLVIRKRQMFKQLIHYFYLSFDVHRKHISFLRQYDAYYSKYFALMFQFLPELFEFIQQHGITSFDMGCTSGYGSYPSSAHEMICPRTPQLKQIARDLLFYLSINQTIEWCNLGIFYHSGIITRKQVEDAVRNHPVMDRVSLTPSRSRSYFKCELPTTLWRNYKTGTFYWNHVRE